MEIWSIGTTVLESSVGGNYNFQYGARYLGPNIYFFIRREGEEVIFGGLKTTRVMLGSGDLTAYVAIGARKWKISNGQKIPFTDYVGGSIRFEEIAVRQNGSTPTYIGPIDAPPIVDTDMDNDGVADYCDNCPLKFNPFQIDIDGDGYGYWCDCASMAQSREQYDDHASQHELFTFEESLRWMNGCPVLESGANEAGFMCYDPTAC